MKLTQAQRLLLGRLLKEKVGEFPPCRVCGNATGWSIGGSLVVAPPVEPEASAAGPFVTMTCTRCGHALLFNARVLGLVGEDGAPSSS